MGGLGGIETEGSLVKASFCKFKGSYLEGTSR